MITYYVRDTTRTPPIEVRFNSYPSIVQYLQEMCQRAYGQNRKQRMILLEEMGHGPDDRDSVTFVRSMAEQFQMGVVREDAHIPCDISTIPLYQKPEFGN